MITKSQTKKFLSQFKSWNSNFPPRIHFKIPPHSKSINTAASKTLLKNPPPKSLLHNSNFEFKSSFLTKIPPRYIPFLKYPNSSQKAVSLNLEIFLNLITRVEFEYPFKYPSKQFMEKMSNPTVPSGRPYLIFSLGPCITHLLSLVTRPNPS